MSKDKLFEYKGLRTGKRIDLTEEQAEALNANGRPVVKVGEIQPAETDTETPPKVEGAKVEQTTETPVIPAPAELVAPVITETPAPKAEEAPVAEAKAEEPPKASKNK